MNTVHISGIFQRSETSESESSVNESEQGNECMGQDDNDDTVGDTRKSREECVPRKKKVEFVKDPSKRRKIDYRTSNSLKRVVIQLD